MSSPEFQYSPPPSPVSYVPPPRRHRLPVLLGLLGGLLVLFLSPRIAQEISYSITRGQEQARYDVAKNALAELPEGVSRYQLAAKVIEPSVVGIDTKSVVAAPAVADEWSFMPENPRYEAIGQGSGVVIDASGYVLTNAHVVSRASQVEVKLSDGRVIRDVELLGADPVTDLAVLKINASNLIAAEWGNSDDLEVGDEVLAVGNPYGLARSVTAGIVSAKDRRVDFENARFRDFLQTDAAVNPGNSGGPLVNMRGQVVGINTAIVGNSYRGISFAIPSRLAKRVFEQLIGSGVVRGWLGVQMQSLTEKQARRLGLDEAQGVEVQAVVEGSPAAKAGIRKGDVILAVNGESVRDAEDLLLAVSQLEVGKQATLDVFRDGNRTKMPVTIEQRPADMFRGKR